MGAVKLGYPGPGIEGPLALERGGLLGTRVHAQPVSHVAPHRCALAIGSAGAERPGEAARAMSSAL